MDVCNQATPNKHWCVSDLKTFSSPELFLSEMSSELLVSRPSFDSRAVAQVPVEPLSSDPNPQDPQGPQRPSGSATAGFRSAKYTSAEWLSNYRSILQRAGDDGHEARSIQRQSRTLHRSTEAATAQSQAEGTRLLGERLQEIHLWRSELQRHIEQLRADTEALVALKTRLERALDATETPFAIATDNVKCRTRRLGADLVRDPVEEELLKVSRCSFIRRRSELEFG